MKGNILAGIVLLNFIAVGAYSQLPSALPVPGMDIQIGAPAVSDSAGDPFRFQNTVDIKKISEVLYHITIDVVPEREYQAGNIDIPFTITLGSAGELEEAKKLFHWIPNLKKSPDDIIAQHVFRSPCVILALKKKSLAFIPDIAEIRNNSIAPYYLDLNYENKSIRINYGLSNYNVVRHQYYHKSNKLFSWTDKVRLSFYVLISPGPSPLAVLKATNHFLWSSFAEEYTHSYLPQTLLFKAYADTGYSMALKDYWVDGPDTSKGGITLTTYYDEATKEYRGRFYKNDLWFHSWFNNTRTAYGLFYWGGELNREDWQQKALASFNLILSSPADKGWFPTIYASEENRWVASGQGGGKELYHMPDNAWTAYWIMRFDDDFRKLAGAEQFLTNFSEALLRSQNSDGSFPARVNTHTLQADSVLQSSASSSMATWYLEEMLLRNKVSASRTMEYKRALRRSLDFLDKYVLPDQRFEDFELYFSCSAKPMHYLDTTTWLYGQNTLAIQWCAEAYLRAYQLFKDVKYLRQGEYCLNILGLYQQVWNPPFINLYAFGGFGVQNTDAEWNDARQAQFAETYLNYYLITKNIDYLERSVYACRSSFALMVVPENRAVCPLNYMGTELNSELHSGNSAENYGHSGYDTRSYQSGFHWGTGSALTSAAILKDKLGDLYIAKGAVIGVDGIVVDSVTYSGNVMNITTKRLRNGPITVGSDGPVKGALVIDNARQGFTIKK